MFQTVSVLVPTRRRLDSLSRLLESFAATAREPGQAELIFRCDSDDAETIERLRQTPFTFITGRRCDGYKSLPVFFNQMANIAHGDVLMCCNDDAEFQTVGWPALLLNEANKYPDGIFNIGVNVGLNDDNFPFSVVSRRMVDAMGCLNDTRLLFSDVFLLDVAKAFNRAVRLDTVTVFHHWAGHDADQTRRDANRYEFELVFKDDHGNWTPTYEDLHCRVVGEAVDRIRCNGPISAASSIALVEQYTPAPGTPGAFPWPPIASCANWNGENPPNTMPYSKNEVSEVICAMFRHGTVGADVVLTSFNNGLPGILWSRIFDRVITIASCGRLNGRLIDGRHTILPGSTGDTAFMQTVIGELTSLRAVIIDETSYASIISPYYLLRPLIKRPGMIVFTNTGPSQPESVGARRFVADLRNGFLDNSPHEIREVSYDPKGPGMSFELLL